MELIIFAVLLIFAGCSSPVIFPGNCDAVANRSETFVCGKETIVKKCRQVVERNESVCDPL